MANDNGWIPSTRDTHLKEDPERLYYLHDELGSTTKVIGENGKTSAHYNYDEFGRPLSSRKFDQNWPGPDNTFGYTGYQYDVSSDLYYAQARYYNAEIGRFISEDPWKGTIVEPNTMNPYPYVLNNPLKYVDPLGLNPNRMLIMVDDGGGGSKSTPAPIVNTKPKQNVVNQVKEEVVKEETSGASDWSCKVANDGTNNPKLGFDSLSDYKTRDQWGANPVNEKVGIERVENPNQYYDSVVIHHTERATDEEIKQLQKYFQKKRKYPDIGYHYVIGGDGTIYEGMPINVKGWHVEKNNTGKIGVVLMGNFNDGTGISGNIKDAINWIKGEGHTKPSKEQIESLKQLIKVLDSQYGIDKVGGHKDFALSTSPSECPGNIAYPILEKEGIIKLGK